jgi:hypothetical protein
MLIGPSFSPSLPVSIFHDTNPVCVKRGVRAREREKKKIERERDGERATVKVLADPTFSVLSISY